MATGARLTEGQAQELAGTEFMPDVLFAPFRITEGGWAISEKEVTLCTTNSWVPALPLEDVTPEISAAP